MDGDEHIVPTARVVEASRLKHLPHARWKGGNILKRTYIKNIKCNTDKEVTTTYFVN